MRGEIEKKLQDLYKRKDIFTFSKEQIRETQCSLIPKVFTYHYRYCESYRNYCDFVGISPEDIKEEEDFIKIPLIPSTMFKMQDIITGEKENIVKVCTSSGTRGSLSKVYRDEATLDFFFQCIRINIEEYVKISHGYCINLGPSQEEARDLWIAYAICMLKELYPMENFIKDGKFYENLVCDRIEEVKAQYDVIILTGSPIMFVQLMRYMEEHKISYMESIKFKCITAGGWKRFEGQKINTAEFMADMQRYFKSLKRGDFIDVLNMVELNDILTGCECGMKHIVPWLKVFILDPKTLKPVPDGQMGLIAYLDPTALSYPGFIISDDFGRLWENRICTCKKELPGIQFERRISTGEQRGCALKLDKQFG